MLFRCTQCRQKYTFDDQRRGQRVKCQKCGTILELPIASAATSSPQSTTAQTSPSPLAQAAPSGSSVGPDEVELLDIAALAAMTPQGIPVGNASRTKAIPGIPQARYVGPSVPAVSATAGPSKLAIWGNAVLGFVKSYRLVTAVLLTATTFLFGGLLLSLITGDLVGIKLASVWWVTGIGLAAPGWLATKIARARARARSRRGDREDFGEGNQWFIRITLGGLCLWVISVALKLYNQSEKLAAIGNGFVVLWANLSTLTAWELSKLLLGLAILFGTPLAAIYCLFRFGWFRTFSTLYFLASLLLLPVVLLYAAAILHNSLRPQNRIATSSGPTWPSHAPSRPPIVRAKSPDEEDSKSASPSIVPTKVPEPGNQLRANQTAPNRPQPIPPLPAVQPPTKRTVPSATKTPRAIPEDAPAGATVGPDGRILFPPGTPVTAEMPIKVGDKLQAHYIFGWRGVTVISVSDRTVTIRWDDEDLSGVRLTRRAELQIPIGPRRRAAVTLDVFGRPIYPKGKPLKSGTPIKVGDRFQAESGGAWYTVQVTQVLSYWEYMVHWVDWGPRRIVPIERKNLQIRLSKEEAETF